MSDHRHWTETSIEFWIDDDPLPKVADHLELLKLERLAFRRIANELESRQYDYLRPLTVLETELWAAEMYLITKTDNKGRQSFPLHTSPMARCAWIADYMGGEIGARQIKSHLDTVTRVLEAWADKGVDILPPTPRLMRQNRSVARAA